MTQSSLPDFDTKPETDNQKLITRNLFGNHFPKQRGGPRPISKFITEDKDGVSWIKIGDTSPGSKYVSKTAQR